MEDGEDERKKREGGGGEREAERARGGEGMGEGGVVEVKRAVWKLQYVSPEALLLP